MFKRKFLRLARMGKAAVAKVIGRLREYLSAPFGRATPAGAGRETRENPDCRHSRFRGNDGKRAVIRDSLKRTARRPIEQASAHNGANGVIEMGGKRAAKNKQPSAAADGAAVVCLPADCRLAVQMALKEQLQQVLQHGDIVIDAQALERVDTAALQLLVLFRRELEHNGGALAWRGTNEVLHEAAALLGLEQSLNLPTATSA
ncbi:MAG: STAS domain-containing protein [Rhodanobacter sp.]|jgi:anti-anti-sigma regulatory factor